jgi:hypothetical protein
MLFLMNGNSRDIIIKRLTKKVVYLLRRRFEEKSRRVLLFRHGKVERIAGLLV